MRKYFWTIVYKLGGANYAVIQHCPFNVRKQYRHLGYAVIICSAIAAISGADITCQYTSSVTVTILGSVLFAGITLSFDYFINNSNSNKIAPKLFRIPVGLANVLLGSAALMVMINQADIDNKLNAQKTASITSCDTTYQAGKARRYRPYNEKKNTVDLYHTTVCLPEAARGYAGPNYMRKHQYCLVQDSALAIEKAQLDTNEAPFNNSYLTKRAALSDVSNAGFPKKCEMLPAVFKENWFTLVVAITVFIISLYIECQSLLLKFSLNNNDEYKQAEAEDSRLYSQKTNENLQSMFEHSNKMKGVRINQANREMEKSWADERLADIIKSAPLYYRLREYQRIFREHKMQESAKQINDLHNAISSNEDEAEKLLNQLIDKMNKN